MGQFEVKRARPQLGFTPSTAVRSNISAGDTGGGAAAGQALIGAGKIALAIHAKRQQMTDDNNAVLADANRTASASRVRAYNATHSQDKWEENQERENTEVGALNSKLEFSSGASQKEAVRHQAYSQVRNAKALTDATLQLRTDTIETQSANVTAAFASGEQVRIAEATRMYANNGANMGKDANEVINDIKGFGIAGAKILANNSANDVYAAIELASDTDGDFTAAKDLAKNPNMPETRQATLFSAINTAEKAHKARLQRELDVIQEKQLGDINQLIFADKNYNASTRAILQSALPEKDKTALLGNVEARAKTAAKGIPIPNDRVEENRLYNLSLDIWTGATTKKQFDEELTKNSGKLDDSAFQRVTTSAANTLKTSQAQDLSRANTEATRQLVDFQSEDAFDKFIADSIKGLSPKASDAFTNKANEIRQTQFREVSNFNAELREWIETNPDKTGKEFFQFSRGLENEYRLAKQSGTTVEQIKDDELTKELNKIPQLESIIMISPEGKRFNVPLDKVQKFTDNGFTGV